MSSGESEATADLANMVLNMPKNWPCLPRTRLVYAIANAHVCAIGVGTHSVVGWVRVCPEDKEGCEWKYRASKAVVIHYAPNHRDFAVHLHREHCCEVSDESAGVEIVKMHIVLLLVINVTTFCLVVTYRDEFDSELEHSWTQMRLRQWFLLDEIFAGKVTKMANEVIIKRDVM
jgi:hypothetical protein